MITSFRGCWWYSKGRGKPKHQEKQKRREWERGNNRKDLSGVLFGPLREIIYQGHAYDFITGRRPAKATNPSFPLIIDRHQPIHRDDQITSTFYLFYVNNCHLHFITLIEWRDSLNSGNYSGIKWSSLCNILRVKFSLEFSCQENKKFQQMLIWSLLTTLTVNWNGFIYQNKEYYIF